MGVQILYTDIKVPLSFAALNWPTEYTDAEGVTQKLTNPSIPIKYGYKTNSLVVEFESGHEQRRKKGATRKTFELTFKALPMEAADKLEEFFIECGGPVSAFNWTDPSNGKAYACRFEGDNFAREYFRHGQKGPLFRVTVSLTQVL